MKRKIKNGSTLYSFLDKQGVLETEDNEIIDNAKKHYWSEYRKNYKKLQRHEIIGSRQ